MWSRRLLAALLLTLASTAVLARLDINSASREELDGLKGIGPVKAQAIVDYRRQHGPFRSVDELQNVPGLGPALIEGFRRDVTVGAAGRAMAEERSAPASTRQPGRTTLGTVPQVAAPARPAAPATLSPPAAPSGKAALPAPARPAMPAVRPAAPVTSPEIPARPAAPAKPVAAERPAPAAPAAPARPAMPGAAAPAVKHEGSSPAAAAPAMPGPARPAMPARPAAN